MGISNSIILPLYRSYFKSLMDSGRVQKENLNIAWLGQQSPHQNPLGNVAMFDSLGNMFSNCNHDFYDIENKPSWDVHDPWTDITGYDLVICLRLNYLVQSAQHLLTETKKVVENNGAYITDFCSGNINEASSLMAQTFGWNRGSSNLVAHLPNYWVTGGLDEKDCSHMTPLVKDDDHLITEEKLKEHSLSFKNYHSFLCAKKRLNLIGILEEK